MVRPKLGAPVGVFVMPVIRGRSHEPKLAQDRKKSLLDRLVAEREGKPNAGGPVIFEIPLEQPDKLDVMVVWDEWAQIRSEDRTQLIREAYHDKEDSLALALGVTYQEAIEQGVLPYRVRLRFGPPPEFTEEGVRAARLSVGGFVEPEGGVELRFPTQTTAEEAVEQLKERLPGSQWVVSYADL
jgi:hypothetical protein